MILSTGIMRAIARSHATIILDVLASPLNAPILDEADFVHDVITINTKRPSSYWSAVRRMRRARYDVVIDCMPTGASVTTLLLMWASGARYRVGVDKRGNDEVFDITVPNDNRVEAHIIECLSPLMLPFGVTPTKETQQPALTLSAAELEAAGSIWSLESNGARHRVRKILMNVSAGTSRRDWPDDKYVAVARHLRQLAPEGRLLLIGAPTDAERARRIAHEGGAEYVKTPSLRSALAMVATADFLFTPDTSIAHAASAFHTPCVAMHPGGMAARWALWGTVGRTLEHSEFNLVGFPVSEAVAAIDEVWKEAGLNLPT